MPGAKWLERKESPAERRRTMEDRHQSAPPVAIDRRVGMHDRRQPTSYGRSPHAA
jgi:hypothetical protein